MKTQMFLLLLLYIYPSQAVESSTDDSYESVEVPEYYYYYPDDPTETEQTPCHETRQCLHATLGGGGGYRKVNAEFVYNSTKYNASAVWNCMLPCEKERLEDFIFGEFMALARRSKQREQKFNTCLQRAGLMNIEDLFSSCKDADLVVRSQHWDMHGSRRIGGLRYKRQANNDNDKLSRIGAYSAGDSDIISTLMRSHTNELLKRCPKVASESRSCIDRVTNGQFVMPDAKDVFSRVCELATKCDPEGSVHYKQIDVQVIQGDQ